MGRSWATMDAFTLEKTKAAKREYYRRNRERIISHVAAYAKRNREKVRARTRKWHTAKIRSSEEYRIAKMWLSAKARARKYNVPFAISKKDIVIPEYCPVFGFKLEPCFKKGAQRNSPSLDRIEPLKGYVKGNIQVISYLANVMKQNATEDELLQFARWVQRRS